MSPERERVEHFLSFWTDYAREFKAGFADCICGSPAHECDEDPDVIVAEYTSGNMYVLRESDIRWLLAAHRGSAGTE